jgi:hypothetical protein
MEAGLFRDRAGILAGIRRKMSAFAKAAETG